MHAEILLPIISTGMSFFFLRTVMENKCLWFYRNQTWLSRLHPKKRKCTRETLYEDQHKAFGLQVLLPTDVRQSTWAPHHKHSREWQHLVHFEIDTKCHCMFCFVIAVEGISLVISWFFIPQQCICSCGQQEDQCVSARPSGHHMDLHQPTTQPVWCKLVHTPTHTPVVTVHRVSIYMATQRYDLFRLCVLTLLSVVWYSWLNNG